MNETEKVNILLVDDRPENLMVLEALLGDLDLNIVKATSGNEALSLMLENDFALVLLDVQMPDISGFETAEIMRESEGTKHIPIIFITAINKEQKHVFKGYDAGAVDYLFKPLDPDILKSKVKVFISLHKQKKALENTALELKNAIENQKKANKALQLEIIERKRAEEEKRKVESKLHQARKMEAIGTLAGGVAHDLNNVLSGIVNYPELLLMDIPEDSPLRKPLLTIKESGEKAATIVQDLLTLARRGVAITEVLNLNDIISDYLKSPEHEKLKVFHPNVKFEMDIEKELLNILGSPVHLYKTIMNLTSNAAEAMPNGGKIFISTKNLYIDRPIKGYDDINEGDYVILAISDNGIGMTPMDMERVFEPFYTKKVMGRSGTGLGMAVVWGTVKDHKGYIDMQSAIEKGSTFTLYFPITVDKLTKDDAIPIEDFKGDGETILVVDDVESQRDISCKMLDTLDYKTKAVSSGEEAVEYLKKHTVDLLLLDMIMDPGINGRETYERIIEIHPNQKAIIISGFAETDEVKAAQKLGAGKYIKKPVTLQKIGLAIKEEL